MLCLQEVLEADMQRWWEAQFPDYRFEMLHQSSSAIGRCVWLLVTLDPGLLLLLCLIKLFAVGTGPSVLSAFALWALLDSALSLPSGYPSWAPSTAVGGFPLFGAKSYFSSTNASLAIGVRKSFGSLTNPQTGSVSCTNEDSSIEHQDSAIENQDFPLKIEILPLKIKMFQFKNDDFA